MTGVAISWVPREPPLAPCAAVGRGAVARLLAARLLHRSDEQLTELSGVAGDDLLVVLGPEAALPWCDGVSYLGRGPGAPALLVPTLLEPSVPAGLLERALVRRFPAAGTPLAVLLGPDQVVELGHARPLDARLLRQRWGQR